MQISFRKCLSTSQRKHYCWMELRQIDVCKFQARQRLVVFSYKLFFLHPKMNATLRLQNELKLIQKTRKFGFYAQPRKSNFLIWDCQFYKDGYFFQLTFTFTKNYPISPPHVIFKNEVYNPNVYPNGAVCLDILGSKWQASLTISDILNGLTQLFDYPNPYSPANGPASALYRKDREAYNEKVKCTNEANNSTYGVLNMIE